MNGNSLAVHWALVDTSRAAAPGNTAAENLEESVSFSQKTDLFSYKAIILITQSCMMLLSPLQSAVNICVRTMSFWDFTFGSMSAHMWTQRTLQSDVGSQNQAEMGQKSLFWLDSIQTLEHFICYENKTNPEATTNILDMCCLATGTKKMTGHSG